MRRLKTDKTRLRARSVEIDFYNPSLTQFPKRDVESQNYTQSASFRSKPEDSDEINYSSSSISPTPGFESLDAGITLRDALLDPQDFRQQSCILHLNDRNNPPMRALEDIISNAPTTSSNIQTSGLENNFNSIERQMLRYHQNLFLYPYSNSLYSTPFSPCPLLLSSLNPSNATLSAQQTLAHLDDKTSLRSKLLQLRSLLSRLD